MAEFEFPRCHACEGLNEYGCLSTDRVTHGQIRNYNKHKKAEDGSNRGYERHHRGLYAFSACEPRVSKIKFVPKQPPLRVRDGRYSHWTRYLAPHERHGYKGGPGGIGRQERGVPRHVPDQGQSRRYVDWRRDRRIQVAPGPSEKWRLDMQIGIRRAKTGFGMSLSKRSPQICS